LLEVVEGAEGGVGRFLRRWERIIFIMNDKKNKNQKKIFLILHI